jgi:hypothetical protein
MLPYLYGCVRLIAVQHGIDGQYSAKLLHVFVEDYTTPNDYVCNYCCSKAVLSKDRTSFIFIASEKLELAKLKAELV